MPYGPIGRGFLRAVIGACLLTTTLMVSDAAAQDRPATAVEFAAGWVGFADDGIVNETLVGGAARWYALPRVSIGPEIAYIGALNHSHLVLTGNLTFDVRRPSNGQSRRVSPFVVVGGGLFQTREHFFIGNFTSNEGAFTAGGGLRAMLGDRLIVGADARVGWELHLRVNGVLGLRLGQ